MKKLLIVESPNKARRIAGLLGEEWLVEASSGHVRDLPLKTLGVDRQHQYQLLYELNEERLGIITRLRERVAQVGPSNVYLATDPDREGEAMAFHLAIALQLPPPSQQPLKRIRLTELTAPALEQALQHPGPLNFKLISAQEARRAIDRLAGFEVSDMLRRKVKPGLSAGRVQSVALKLVVEREEAIDAFVDRCQTVLRGTFCTRRGDTFTARLDQPFSSPEQARAFLECVTYRQYSIGTIAQTTQQELPPLPFTTATLQQEGVRELGLTVRDVMEAAGKLYESGAITFPRSDSPYLPTQTLEAIRQEIKSRFGDEFVSTQTPANRPITGDLQQAIRPTDMSRRTAGTRVMESALYELIYQRTLASQMPPARYQCLDVRLEQSRLPQDNQWPQAQWVTQARQLIAPGFRVLSLSEKAGTTSDEPDQLPRQGFLAYEVVAPQLLTAREEYLLPPLRYDEASLVAELETLGIGRPSTYAAIIDTLTRKKYLVARSHFSRSLPARQLRMQAGLIREDVVYVSVGGDAHTLEPTESGVRIITFLKDHFLRLLDNQLTAELEQHLDQITVGLSSYLDVVTAFDVVHSTQLAEVDGALPDLESERPVPTLLGQFENAAVQVGQSEHGIYITHKNAFYTVPGVENPVDISLPMAIEAIKQKRQQQAHRQQDLVRQIGRYQIRQGQYGLFLSYGEHRTGLKNETKDTVQHWTLQTCQERMDRYLAWKKKGAS